MAGTYNSSFELQYAGAKVQSSLYPIFTSSKFTLQRWENRPRDSRVLIRLRTQQRNGNRVLQKMSVGQRALLVFIDWSFMPPPPQKQQLKFPKQEAMTKKDPELPCPLGCGMTCQGYTGTQYGNDRDQHTHIHNTCCRKDFYHISEINIRTSADLLSSFRFRGSRGDGIRR